MRLVVLVSVDQLLPDQLEKYDSLFTGGLRRLRDEGFRYTQAEHRFAWTKTAPGHATLATGTYPCGHGIVSNDWWQEGAEGWFEMYAVGDSESPLVGVSAPRQMGRSPANLARSGLADWIEAADRHARVVSISRKDRAAIPMAGRTTGHVYWTAPGETKFVTSRYYRRSLPDWVRRFNDNSMPSFVRSKWDLELSSEQQAFARPDSFPGEGDRGIATFPHVMADEVDDNTTPELHEWWVDSPFPDEAVLALAREAIAELELGRRGTLDYLALGLSSTDEIGHDFGPHSLEVLDNLMRLDRLLGELLDVLDTAAGPGGWVLALSADHGVLPLPERRWDNGLEAHRVERAQIRSARALRDEILADGEADAIDRLAEGLERFEWIERVVSAERLLADAAGDQTDLDADLRELSENLPGLNGDLGVLIRNSSFSGRFANDLGPMKLALIFRPGTLLGYYEKGTDHGSPYWYDRHVPVIFMGGGVEPGLSDDRVSTADVAPTLADLAGVPFPPDLDGRPLRTRP